MLQCCFFLIYFHFECSMNYFKITSSLKICILDSGIWIRLFVAFATAHNTPMSCFLTEFITQALCISLIYTEIVVLARFAVLRSQKFSLKLLTSFSVGFIRWHVCCFVPCETSAIIMAIDRWFWIVFRHCIICNCFGLVWFGSEHIRTLHLHSIILVYLEHVGFGLLLL